MRKVIPRVESGWPLYKAETWFSNDVPHMTLDRLKERPIPNEHFLEKLESAARQAWLNGAQSLVDHRYNDGCDRLPLCSVTYWKEMLTVAKARATWFKCEKWLSVAPHTQGHTADMDRAFEEARIVLPTLGWMDPVKALNAQFMTIDFARLLGEDWMTGELVDMMIRDASHRPEVTNMKKTLLGGTEFGWAMGRSGDKNYSRSTTTLLSRYEKHVQDHGIEHLYFPANVNENHWIAVHVDFRKREFEYGK
jgi:hypothetical protein